MTGTAGWPPPDPIRTELVVLESIGLDDVEDMLAGRRHCDWHPEFPREDDCDGVRMMHEVSEWSSRSIRLLASGQVVGTIGFFGPPEPGDDGVLEAEVGYGLVAPARGAGVMSSALPALLTLTDRLGVRVRAHTEPDNAASQAVLRRAGFVQDGEMWRRPPRRPDR